MAKVQGFHLSVYQPVALFHQKPQLTVLNISQLLNPMLDRLIKLWTSSLPIHCPIECYREENCHDHVLVEFLPHIFAPFHLLYFVKSIRKKQTLHTMGLYEGEKWKTIKKKYKYDAITSNILVFFLIFFLFFFMYTWITLYVFMLRYLQFRSV